MTKAKRQLRFGAFFSVPGCHPTGWRHPDAVCETDGGRRIELRTRRRPETVEIVVCDTGPGIAPGLEERIFDPFFTTKEVGHGTGLGLSITYGIVTDHGGAISVGTTDDGGGAFTIELPLADVEPSEQLFA